MDIFSGDSQEQDGSQCKHQQHDWDGTSEALSHKVRVSAELPFLWPGWKFKPRPNSTGKKVASPCTDVITACVWFTLHLLPASRFTFHLSWQSLNLNFCSSPMWLTPHPPLCSAMKATPRLLVLWREKGFFLSQPERLHKPLLVPIPVTVDS